MAQRKQAEERLRAECEETRLRSRHAQQQLQEELAKTQQYCTDTLLQAEADKQQALSEMELEKTALTERILALQCTMETAALETERMRRDFLSKQEQDKVLAGLQMELLQLHARFDESLSSREVSEKRLSEQRLQRDLSEAEESRDAGRRELIQACRELEECAQERDARRMECMELQRALGDESRMKEAMQSSNQELRAAVKRAENDNNRSCNLKRSLEEREQRLVVSEECKSSLQEEALKLRSGTRDLEKSHLQARRELQELRRQVKTLERERHQLARELSEVQTRLVQEEQKEEAGRREAFLLKQRLLEGDAGREAALKEVRHTLLLQKMDTHSPSHTFRHRRREADLQEIQQKQREEVARLEAQLQEAQTQQRELSLGRSLAEGQALGLEEQLAQVDASRADLEHRLSILTSALRRTLGVGRGGRPPTPGSRGRSEGVSSGLAEGMHGSSPPVAHVEEGELDLDAVQSALSSFQQELRDAQRERVWRKRDLQERLEGVQVSLSLQEEAVCHGDREKRMMGEELSRLKNSLQAAEAEVKALQERLEWAEASEAGLGVEHRRLKEGREAAEMRVSRLERSQRALEGELHRRQLRAAELEAERDSLKERVACLRKELAEAEERNALLKVERLAAALARAEVQEAELRERLRSTSVALSDSSSSAGAAQEQVAQLQSALSASEQDRRTQQVSRTGVLHPCQALGQRELLAQEARDACARLQRERGESQERLSSLATSLQRLQEDKAQLERSLVRLGKDKSSLKRTLEKVRARACLHGLEHWTSTAGEAVRRLEQEVSESQSESQILKVRETHTKV
uniref:Ciliary rootlet coiled-coil, rootletin family member 2 n=1 Tax=Electrophorus electricus TaxID=8005 RepID=A0AAY5EGY6_ELEEL